MLASLHVHLHLLCFLFLRKVAAHKQSVILMLLLPFCNFTNQISILSSVNEDGLSSGGSAGGRDCCDWDREPANHLRTDRHFGTGNTMTSVFIHAVYIYITVNIETHGHSLISGIHDCWPRTSSRSHSNTGPASQRTDSSGPWCYPGCTAVCYPVPAGPGCTGKTHTILVLDSLCLTTT